MRNVPKLRFSGFSDEWEETSISNVCKLSSGSTPSKAKQENWNGEYLWVTSGELKSKFIYDTIDKTTEQGKKESNLREYEKGTFVIAIYGLEAQGTRGSSAILGEKATISQACMALEPIKDLNSEFLYSWYQKYGEMIGIRYAQGTKQQNLSTDLVGNLRIVVPKKEEQEKIANFLTKVDKLIEKQDEKVSNLEQYKKGMMQKIFSQEIRFKKDDGGEYPGWNEITIGEVCTINTGKKDTQDREEGGTYPFFVRSQIVERINSYSYDGEAILTAGDGVGVGKVFHYVNCKFDYHQRVYKLSDFNGVTGRFLFEYFSENFKREVAKYNAKTSVDSVRLEMITKMKMPLPCIEEQTKIANLLSKIDSIVEKEKEKLEELRDWKKGLLQGMFV